MPGTRVRYKVIVTKDPHRFGLIYLDILFPVDVPGKTKHATIVSEILEIGL